MEALLNAPGPASTTPATHAALVCHPHPLYGGTMHNKVVFQAMKSLQSFGFPVLRINFRGAGLSEGKHDQGRGEVDDVRAALDWLHAKSHLPMIFTGFSFGAATGLRAACPDSRVVALISLGTPVNVESRGYGYECLRHCYKPKLLVSGSLDQYGPAEKLREIASSLSEPKELKLIDGADHFFEGRLDEMREAIEEWLRRFLAGKLSLRH
jgi:alpha/beta superfamily hydrolase